MVRIAVIGGGISGLSAAWELVRSEWDDALAVTIFESSNRWGGPMQPLHLSSVGLPLDAGAESLLATRGEGLDLAEEVGLANHITEPLTASAAIFSQGKLQGIPTETVMGIPQRPEDLSGILTESEHAAIADHDVAALSQDISIGEWVDTAFSPKVTDRLVDPLLGGVYAGKAREISFQAAVPQLWKYVQEGGRPTELVARSRAETINRRRSVSATRRPFFGLEGGVWQLPHRLTHKLAEDSRVSMRLGTPVTQLIRTIDGWRVGSTTTEEQYDAVILAVPAFVAAELLAEPAADTAGLLKQIPYSSVALVAASVETASQERVFPEGSGFLVPADQGFHVKAGTYVSQKWGWAGKGTAPAIRLSIGRIGDTWIEQHSDEEIADTALSEARIVTGKRLAVRESTVIRWPRSLPQYAPGHVQLVAKIREFSGESHALWFAGAAYDGVGIPACISSGRRAAQQIFHSRSFHESEKV